MSLKIKQDLNFAAEVENRFFSLSLSINSPNRFFWARSALNSRKPRKAIFALTVTKMAGRKGLRWLPTVLTVSTPEKGWRTKNKVFVATLGLSSWHSQWRLATHLGFHFRSYEYIADCCRGKKTIAKITIFLLLSTYLLPFPALASVKYLETLRSCENDFGRHLNLKKWKLCLGDS